MFSFPEIVCDGTYGVTSPFPIISASVADLDKRYHAAIAEQGTKYETIEKERVNFTLHLSSIEDAYVCVISLLASGEGKQLI